MSEWRVEVVHVGPVEKHPNADALSITQVHGGYPCIIRTGDFHEGDLAIYVPVDSVVPASDERWAFLDGHRRIRAKRLRGIFSMGLLVRSEEDMVYGELVHDRLGIIKYEPPEDLSTGGENERDPGFLPVYTDIEGLRRWPDLLQPGEPVVVTEKIHGANGRWLWHDGRLWVGSHTNIKREHSTSLWWSAAARHNMAQSLRLATPDLAIYGEVYGQVQDLKYGVQSGVSVVCFDVLDITTRKYLDYDSARAVLMACDLPCVPELYCGPWGPECWALAEGLTTIPGANHVREGFVVRPKHERWDASVGRVILKLIGEGYHLRKERR